MVARLEITLKSHLFDAEGASLCRKIRDYFGWDPGAVRVIHVLTLDTDLTQAELEAVRREIFTNPVTQVSSFQPMGRDFSWAIWVGFRPGVRDTAGSVAIEAIADYLGRPPGAHEAAYTSKIYLFSGAELEQGQVEILARELLANDIIQQWRIYSRSQWDETQGIGLIVPKVRLAHTPAVAEIPIPSDEALMALSQERNLALNPQDVPVIRSYFGRPEVLDARRSAGLSAPTDVELEAISQARSDHCNHNTFRGKFHYRDLATGEETIVDNLFKTCIEAPTLTIQKQKDWVVSVLWDNAGVARFDENHNYAITGETHNSPSNMEAYGGSLTGIVGIYRDIMGTGKGARLVAGLYGYCVGPRDYAGPLRPRLHPRRLLDGIVEGVRDGGNKHGVPTPFGNLFFHPSYLGKCLVFVASLGIMPREVLGEPSDQKRPRPGDCIIMSGGRVGKDGIHGVTASSEIYSENTPAGHVQIGDPYTQKKMHDFLLEARDEGLVTFITDNGGGGLSSSVGESAQFAGGAVVELDEVPLKYEGLDVWEIWISESQERMTVAVDPKHLDRFLELSRRHEVESTVIGHYTGSGKLHLSYSGKTCAQLDLSFFSEAFPQWEFDAHWTPPEARGLLEPVLSEPRDHAKLLHTLLARPNLSSREWIQRQYDHEVQGGSAVKFLVGRERDVPNDAVVLRPLLDSPRGLAVSQTLNPTYSLIDAYPMVAASIDEAVRRLLAVGAFLDEIGGVDNFCWPSIQYDAVQNPDGRYKAALLVRANWALRDMCLAYGIPLLSGKDSMYVDGHLPGAFEETHKVSGLPTMQFTATGVVPQVSRCLTLEPKVAGDLVYVLGSTGNELGGSEYYDLMGEVGLNVPTVEPRGSLKLYKALEGAISGGLLASCHGIYRGGLAVHAAMAAFASSFGMTLDLQHVPQKECAAGRLRDDQLLFSETCGRFLVTVSPACREAFEARFQGLPCARVGEVTQDPRLVIRGQKGDILVEESLASLKRSWKQGNPATE
ncbi:AIR synthase-related protein [Desulforhabdus sp. TSK]|uniref:AIR synthase-related protein n=1 Tax=Desulforhabdus sp. TSK TaxID=2925014 RepID=UPI001FC7D9FA|nr:AIR synthase-related protein [Desulforhabdus sp. TSK]GKT09592.1 phosphoribosylformylglycinamidine synthase subunit PurL [Desulforhabdus sp. TSK]